MSNIIMKMLKIKEAVPNLPNKKIDLVQKVINSSNVKPKLKINMTTKSPSRKQVIVPINNKLAKKFIKNSSMHVVNINCALKNIWSNTIANFIQAEDKGIIITTNNISLIFDLQEIKKYVKSSLISDSEQVSTPRLPQSKSYLKIVGIPFISKRMNTHIFLNEIENVLKTNHLFNNIILTSKPCIIKVSPKSDMSIIWINIWDTQSRSNAKKIINRHFNIGSFIATVGRSQYEPGYATIQELLKVGSYGKSMSYPGV